MIYWDAFGTTEHLLFIFLSMLFITARAQRVDCVKQSNVVGMFMRPLYMQGNFHGCNLIFLLFTGWNFTLCFMTMSRQHISCRRKQQELVCATRGQPVNTDCSLVRGQFSNTPLTERPFDVIFIFCNWALKLYIGCEFVKNHVAIVSGSFIYQSASRPIDRKSVV